MIIINPTKCNLCGLCVKICHEHCLHIINESLSLDYKYCSTCTQCIAVCPQLALSWNDHPSERFDKASYPGIAQVLELFMERRTIRDYTDKKIEKSILKEITEFAIYAPTHNFNLRAIVIDIDEIIDIIDTSLYKFSANIYHWLYKLWIIPFLLKLFSAHNEFEYLKAKPKLEKVINRGHGFKTKPSAIIMLVGNKSVPLTLESAQYALYNIDLYGQAKGLACRNLVGNQSIINRNKNFRRMTGLNKKEKIVGLLAVGYPAIKFKNKVLGKEINIQWNSVIN